MSKKKKSSNSSSISRQDRLALLEARFVAMKKEMAELKELIMQIDARENRGENVMLTTQEAADYIGSSRPYIIKLIEEGKLSCEMVGTHRRINLQILKKYEEEQHKLQRAALIELQRLEQELGI
jgi:excisionase family DNA binding protein